MYPPATPKILRKFVPKHSMFVPKPDYLVLFELMTIFCSLTTDDSGVLEEWNQRRPATEVHSIFERTAPRYRLHTLGQHKN